MELSNGYIRPGKVLKVVNNYGTIKCSAVGVFAEDADPDKLPPVIPFTKTSSTSFSQPHEGDKIWVILFYDNPQEIFYMFQGDVGSNSADVLDNSYGDVEIVTKRNDGQAVLGWSDNDGWKMKQGPSYVSVDSNNDITLSKDDDTTTVRVDSAGVHLTSKSGEEEQVTVMGDHMKDWCNSLISLLQSVSTAAKSNPQTIQIGAAIDSKIMSLKLDLESILAKNTFVN